MNFNKILQSLFGNKSTRDMKLIQPLVEKVKEAYPAIKALSNDELRAKTKEIQKYIKFYFLCFIFRLKSFSDWICQRLLRVIGRKVREQKKSTRKIFGM